MRLRQSSWQGGVSLLFRLGIGLAILALLGCADGGTTGTDTGILRIAGTVQSEVGAPLEGVEVIVLENSITAANERLLVHLDMERLMRDGDVARARASRGVGPASGLTLLLEGGGGL